MKRSNPGADLDKYKQNGRSMQSTSTELPIDILAPIILNHEALANTCRLFFNYSKEHYAQKRENARKLFIHVFYTDYENAFNMVSFDKDVMFFEMRVQLQGGGEETLCPIDYAAKHGNYYMLRLFADTAQSDSKCLTRFIERLKKHPSANFKPLFDAYTDFHSDNAPALRVASRLLAAPRAAIG